MYGAEQLSFLDFLNSESWADPLFVHVFVGGVDVSLLRLCCASRRAAHFRASGAAPTARPLGNRRTFVAAPTPRSPPHEEPAAAAAALMQQPFSTSRSRLHSTTRSRSGSAGRRSTLVATSVGSEDDQEADPRRWSIEADGRILKAKPITLICYFVFALKYLIFFQGTGIRARA